MGTVANKVLSQVVWLSHPILPKVWIILLLYRRVAVRVTSSQLIHHSISQNIYTAHWLWTNFVSIMCYAPLTKGAMSKCYTCNVIIIIF